MKSKSSTAVIVIPTYNEAGNIGKMIDYLFTKTFPDIESKKTVASDWQMKILVVDDSSPDGTGKIVLDQAKKHPHVFLLSRPPKSGIGSAYLDGFKYAMAKLDADVLFEFDADFQHPPETIPLMLAKIDRGYDYVVGSRKIKGGAEPEGRNLWRTFLTEGGGLAARTILFFPFNYFFAVTDPTTGLKATRVKGIADHLNLNASHLYSRKFGYKVQLYFDTLKLGAKYIEVPLKFENRQVGESKFESDTMIEILLSCLKTRWYDDVTQKFFKFGVVGGFGFVVNVVGAKFFKSFLGSSDLSLSVINGLANALAAEISIISNFTWNNIWTFSSTKITRVTELLTKFLTFNLSSIVTGIVIPSVVIALLTEFFGDHLFIYQVLAIFGLTIPLNWLVYNKIIWQKK